MLRVPPKDRAHTPAERHGMALGVVEIPSLNLRCEILWRGVPLDEPRPLCSLRATA
jgi:hypothetical protein